MSWTVEHNPDEPAHRFLREKGWIQQRGRSGAPNDWWAEPGTGKIYPEAEALERAKREGKDHA